MRPMRNTNMPSRSLPTPNTNSFMKKIILIKLLALFVVGCQKGNDPSVLKEVFANYEEALSSKSAEKVANSFFEDARILPEGKNVVIGRNAIIEHFSGLESIDFQESFEIEEVIESGDNFIVQTKNIGSWRNPESNDSGNFEVKGQLVIAKDSDGLWKILRYAYSGNGLANVERAQPIIGEFAHVVLFWLKNPDSKEDRETFESAMRTMIKNSEYIKSVHFGLPANTPREIVDNSYTYSYIATFASKEDQDAYQTEKAHDVFRNAVGHLFDKIRIYDSLNM